MLGYREQGFHSSSSVLPTNFLQNKFNLLWRKLVHTKNNTPSDEKRKKKHQKLSTVGSSFDLNVSSQGVNITLSLRKIHKMGNFKDDLFLTLTSFAYSDVLGQASLVFYTAGLSIEKYILKGTSPGLHGIFLPLVTKHLGPLEF